jgi:hypothetical protein
MATLTAEPIATSPAQAAPDAFLGGAPAPNVPPLGGDGDKAARKGRKQDEKLRRDAARPPRSFERWRILMDVVDEGRRVVDLADHKARYALVVMGALNAGVFLVLSRAHLISTLSAELKPWVIGFLVVYAGLTCLFVFHAIDCLRPRQLRESGLPPGVGPGAGPHAPLGLLYWEMIGAHDLAGYQRAWSAVRMEQLNSEAVLISHQLAKLIAGKYRALGRLYWGLATLVGLAALQLIVYASFALTD